MKFIHAADIHLDSPLKGLETYDDAPVDEIRGATRRAFDNLIESAIAEEVDFVLIAGDLYDGDWKDYRTGLFFVDRIGRLDKAGIPVFIVSGNHDAASQTTKTMPLPENVTLFSTRKPSSKQLKELGVVIHGQSYASRAVTDNLAVNFPPRKTDYFNIGLLHTSLSGKEGVHKPYAPCSVEDLQTKGYDYWGLGHVHKREVILQDPWIVFPGNIQGRHIRENGAKGASLVVVEDNRVIEIKHLELDVLRWTNCVVDLSSCETTDSVYEHVRMALEEERDLANNRTVAIRLQLEGRCPTHAQLMDRIEQWTEEFRGLAAGLGNVWLEKVLFRTQRTIPIEEIVADNTPMIGLLQSIQTMNLDNEQILAMVPELSTLKNKLPSHLFDEDESMLPADQESLLELREEVRELLIAKLVEHGGNT